METSRRKSAEFQIRFYVQFYLNLTRVFSSDSFEQTVKIFSDTYKILFLFSSRNRMLKIPTVLSGKCTTISNNLAA